jgi:4-amino-4-deoxy-L-arabinose transferase-like glycosyltransferase
MALWGWPVALLGAVLVGYDPLNLAMARIFHMDGLMASFMLLAVMALLGYFHRGRRWLALLVSGAAAGLAWLSKSPGFFLVPFTALLFAIDLAALWRVKPGRSMVQQIFQSTLLPLGFWLVCGGVVYGLLWPAMWVDPVGTLQRVLAQAGSYAAEGHGSANYFLGEIFYITQRPTSTYFFYPIAYLWRITPIALAGLALLIPAFWQRWKPLDEGKRRKPAASLLVYALLFALFMTLGAKLLDRYLLPAMLAFDLLAACGWVAAATRLGRSVGSRGTRWVTSALLLGVALLQISGTLRTHPYYFTYYNPLAGGIKTAPQVLMFGWGEGLDEAGRYLSQKPEAESLQAASWYGYGSFSYFFPGQTIVIPALPDVPQDALDRFLAADYLVIYSHQWQRNTPASLLAAIKDWQPEHSIWLNGLEYARIYPTGQPISP